MSGVVTALFGKNSAVPAKGGQRPVVPHGDLRGAVRALVFVAALTVVISFLVDMLFGAAMMPADPKDIQWTSRFVGPLVGLAVAGALSR